MAAAYLTGAWGVRANAREADFSYAHLERTRLMEADLRRADFVGAQVEGADFTDAQVDEARFGGCDLGRGARGPDGGWAGRGSGARPERPEGLER